LVALALGFPLKELPTLPDESGNSWFPDSVKLFNSGQKNFFSDHPASPWNYLLACEGLQLLVGGTSRRLASHVASATMFPFVIRAPSPSSKERAGKEKAEFWAPLWHKPATLAEVGFFLKQGRASLQGRSVVRPHHMAQAIIRRSVQGGISEFQRHALIHTTSKNTFEVLPAERYRVGAGSIDAGSCLAELRSWEEGLPRDTSKVVRGFRRRVENAILAVCEFPESQERWQQLLLACAQIDLRLDRNKAFRKHSRPVPPLSLRWLEFLIGANREPESEFVLAASIASIAGFQTVGNEVRWSPLRENIFNIEAYHATEGDRTSWATFTDNPSSRVVWSGLNLVRDLAEVLRRRCIDSPLTKPLALYASYRCPPDVLGLFATGQLDDLRIQQLLPALSLLNWAQALPRQVNGSWKNSMYIPSSAGLPAAWRSHTVSLPAIGVPISLCYLKPIFQPHNFALDPKRKAGPLAFGDREYPPRAPETLAALMAGHLAMSVEEANRRLRSCGLLPIEAHVADVDADECRRLAAALLVPWDKRQLQMALKQVTEFPIEKR
jgi:CRISPR-associated protein Csx17